MEYMIQYTQSGIVWSVEFENGKEANKALDLYDNISSIENIKIYERIDSYAIMD